MTEIRRCLNWCRSSYESLKLSLQCPWEIKCLSLLLQSLDALETWDMARLSKLAWEYRRSGVELELPFQGADLNIWPLGTLKGLSPLCSPLWNSGVGRQDWWPCNSGRQSFYPYSGGILKWTWLTRSARVILKALAALDLGATDLSSLLGKVWFLFKGDLFNPHFWSFTLHLANVSQMSQIR